MSNEGWQRPEGITDEEWESAKEIARIRAAEAPQEIDNKDVREKADIEGLVERKVPWPFILSGLVQSIILLASSPAFLVGFFTHNSLLLNTGCILNGLIIAWGMYNRQYRWGCVMLTICVALALVFRSLTIWPWYVGFLWPWAILGLGDIPISIVSLLTPRQTGAELWLRWQWRYDPGTDRYYYDPTDDWTK